MSGYNRTTSFPSFRLGTPTLRSFRFATRKTRAKSITRRLLGSRSFVGSGSQAEAWEPGWLWNVGQVTRLAAIIVMVAASGLAIGSEPSEQPAPQERATLILVRGADGTEEFGQLFDEWENRWSRAAEVGDVSVTIIGKAADPPPFDVLRAAVADEVAETAQPLWIVFLGHGTFDSRAAKFNLTGPDVSANELAGWLEPMERPLAVINCTSSSGPFINRLSREDRIVIAATSSGHEVNFARFGNYFSAAINDLSADLDKDGQVSLLEAFLIASRQTKSYYDGLGQLATEHALLEDTGDQRGVTADFFEGLKRVKTAEGGETLDGHRAHQWHFVPSEQERQFPDELRPRRNELELAIADLRDRKSQQDEDSYYAELEELLIELAELYEQADRAEANSGDALPADSSEAESKTGS